jgi:hypothetical protein
MSICFSLSQRSKGYLSADNYLRVASWLNEVQTGMDTVVNNFESVNTILLFQVRVEARFDILHDGFPTTRESAVWKKLSL